MDEKLTYEINGWELTESEAKLLLKKICNSKIPIPTVIIVGKKELDKQKLDVIFDK